MRVLQVGAGVALESQHAVPVEDVVPHPLRRKVCVLDRTDAQGTGHPRPLLGAEITGTLGHRGVGAGHAFGQQVDQSLGVPGPAGQLLPTGTENEPEADVHGLRGVRQVAGKPGDVEHQSQVERLFGADDVHQRGGAASLGAVADARQIRGGVAVAPVRFAHD